MTTETLVLLFVVGVFGFFVIPGLINAHTHLYQNFLKGLNDGVPLVEWCEQVLFPAADVIRTDQWDAHDERMGYSWSLVAALEMIKSGTTCCINMDMRTSSARERAHIFSMTRAR